MAGNTPEYNQTYYEKNKDRIKRKKRQWYIKNRESIIAKQCAYNKRAREALKELTRLRNENVSLPVRRVSKTSRKRTRSSTKKSR